MIVRRLFRALKLRVIVRLDQFVSWPPSAQLPLILLFTLGLIAAWALLWSSATGLPLEDAIWEALTRFMDGGTMAQDRGEAVRFVAVGTTATGVLVVSFLTGAFASKLGERLQDLRSGRSPTLQKHHVLLLGFDPKVPLFVRELARSNQRLRVVVLAAEDKARMEATFRVAAPRTATSRLRVICRTGDPRSELALLGVCADRARVIVVTSPPHLDDEHALRASVSTLLAVRRVVGPDYRGRILVETRRAIHGALLALTCEPGVAGPSGLPIEVFATDDIVARVIAQSIRQGGVYFALREMLSFRGSELYLEPVPPSLLGQTFDAAHARVRNGIAVGVYRPGDGLVLVPHPGEPAPLRAQDQLIVLEEERRALTVEPAAAISAPATTAAPLPRGAPQKIRVIGANRTLPRLVAELDRILMPGSTVEVVCPPLSGFERHALEEVERTLEATRLARREVEPGAPLVFDDPGLYTADGVVILGCEDEQDPDGDASALSILLRIRHARRALGHRLERLVTEVRDPATARQVASAPNDFLVSADVVAMLLAQACLEPRLIPAYREILDPTGVEVFVMPRRAYVSGANAVFGDAMSAARARGEIAIGFFPHARETLLLSTRMRIELGKLEIDETNPVFLNPPRETPLPDAPDTQIVVLAHPPGGFEAIGSDFNR